MGRAKRTGKRVTDPSGEVRVVDKNANREGSVYFDAANRVWNATWYDATGKRRTVTAATRTEVEGRRDAKLADRAARPSGGPLGDEPSGLKLVFTAGDGRPVPRQALHRAVRDACVRAGIDTEAVGTHTARRTVVSLAYQAGVDIADVARLVGHAQTSTTAGYLIDRGHRPAVVAAKVAAQLDPATI